MRHSLPDLRRRARSRAPSLRLVLVLLLFILTLSVSAAEALTTAVSLDIQPGARQNGMGAAGVALVGNSSDAMWWNPAALGFATWTSAEFTRARLIPGLADDVFHYHVAIASPLASFGGLGASFTHLTLGETAGIPGSWFESSPAIGVGVRVHPDLAIGATLKWVRVQSGFLGAETWGGDAGVLWHADRSSATYGLGVMYQNFGGRAKFAANQPAYSLSGNLKLGAAVDRPMQLTPDLALGGMAVVDFNQSTAESDFRTWNGGAEAYLKSTDLLRIAARVGYYYDRLGEIRDFTFGAELRIGPISADAGWIPQARDSGLDRVCKLTLAAQYPLPSGSN